MFSDLNPLDKSTALLEIGIMLLGAFLIGLIFAFLFFKARKKQKSAAENLPEADKKELEQLRKSAKSWKEKLKAKDDEIAGLKQNSTGNKNERQALEIELNEIKAKLVLLEKEKVELADELKVAEQVPKVREDEIDLLKGEKEKLEKKIGELQKKIETLEKNDSGNEMIESLKAENRKLEKANQELDASVKKLREDAKKLAVLHAEHEALERAKLKAEGSVNVVQKQMEDVAAAKEQTEKDLKIALEEKEKLEKELKAVKAGANTEKQREANADEQRQKWQKEAEAREQEAEELRKRLKELQDKAVGNPAANAQSGAAVTELRAKLKQSETEADKLRKQVSNLEDELAKGESGGEDTLNTRIIHKLTMERDQLKKELEALKSGNVESPAPKKEPVKKESVPFRKDNGPVANPPAPKKQGIQLNPEVDYNFSHLGTPPEGFSDDLTKIDGISTEIADLLRDIGIKTYFQMAQLNEADRFTLDRLFSFEPGTVKNEKWVKQAKKMVDD